LENVVVDFLNRHPDGVVSDEAMNILRSLGLKKD
jgi:hypothetical protein